MAYRDARGVKKNLVYAYAWLSIAAKKLPIRVQKLRKDYEDRQENLNRDDPQCEYVLEGGLRTYLLSVMQSNY